MWLSELRQSLPAAEPFFTNDAAGYGRVLFAFLLGMSPIFGLVVWFLRRGPDERITRVENDLTNLGEKVDRMGQEQARDREAVASLHRDIAENQREMIETLGASARAIQESIHQVDLRVARMEERSDISEAFDRFGARIERVIEKAARRLENNDD